MLSIERAHQGTAIRDYGSFNSGVAVFVDGGMSRVRCNNLRMN